MPHRAGEQPLTPDWRAVDDAFARGAAEASAPGTAWGVVLAGELVHAGGLGSLGDGRGVPDERSVFRIASMTKSFTAAAVLRLRDAGAVALDTPVAEYVPEAGAVVPATSDSPAITVRHLLTMSAGLASDDPWADRLLDIDVAGLDALLAGGATFAVAPGVAMEYSNLGWAILGRVVARVSGCSLQEYVSTELLAPLGLHDTTWSAPLSSDRVAVPHRKIGGAVRPDAAPLGDGGFAPMGGLWSTVGDLARWVAFFCDAFPPRDGVDDGPLRRATRREMQQAARAWLPSLTPATPGGPLVAGPGGYGMGLQIGHDLRFGPMVNHSGGLPGYGSNMWWLPERSIGVIGLANITYAPMRFATLAALEALHAAGALPAARPLPVSPALSDAAARLVALLGTWDDAEAATLFSANVALDDPLLHRREVAERIGAVLGTLRPLEQGRIEPVTATDATAVVVADRGELRIDVQLSPEVPPRVQWYEATAVARPGDDVVAAAHDAVVVHAGYVLGPCVAHDGGESATFRVRGHDGSRLELTVTVGDGETRAASWKPLPLGDA